jgi:hypothetical protein
MSLTTPFSFPDLPSLYFSKTEEIHIPVAFASPRKMLGMQSLESRQDIQNQKFRECIEFDYYFFKMIVFFLRNALLSPNLSVFSYLWGSISIVSITTAMLVAKLLVLSTLSWVWFVVLNSQVWKNTLVSSLQASFLSWLLYFPTMLIFQIEWKLFHCCQYILFIAVA